MKLHRKTKSERKKVDWNKTPVSRAAFLKQFFLKYVSSNIQFLFMLYMENVNKM